MEQFVNGVGQRFVRNEALSEDALDVFIYGLDVLIFNLASIIAILLCGLAIGHFRETVLCLLAYSPLQTIGGGYHAKTHFRCCITTLTGWAVAMLIITYLPNVGVMFLMGTGILSVFLHAPIEHVNAPMSFGHKRKMQRLARILCMLIASATLIAALFHHDYAIPMAVGLGMVGISMNASKLFSYNKH